MVSVGREGEVEDEGGEGGAGGGGKWGWVVRGKVGNWEGG